MPPARHRITFDESGGFATNRSADEWAIVALVTDEAPSDAPARAWKAAWGAAGRSAPPLHAFHAAQHKSPAVLERVARELARLPQRGFEVVAVGGDAAPGAPGVGYVEAALSTIVRVASRWGSAPAGIDVWSARRSPLDLPGVERLARERLRAVWPASGGAAPNVAVNWHVSTPYDDAALAWSDLLGWLALQTLRSGADFPFELARLDAHDASWRFDPVAPLAVAAAPAQVGTLARLAAADAALEQRRDRARAESELLLAKDALARRGPAGLDRDELSVAVDSLELALDNHAGVPAPRHGAPGPDPRSTRLLAAGRALPAVLLYENRRVVARTHSWQFGRALTDFRPVVSWVAGLAANPFGPPGAQPELGRMLGTLGQLVALDASARRDATALDEADRCFTQAIEHFSEAADRQRQLTYRLHVLAERLRLAEPGWSGARALDAADALDGEGTRAALARVLAAGAAAAPGDVFRLQAWAKLTAVVGAPPEPAATRLLVTGELPTWHPWPALCGWLRCAALAAGARAVDPAMSAASVYLGQLTMEPGLVALQAFLLLQEGASPPTANPARVRALVPAAARQGWVDGGFDARLGADWSGVARPTDLLPFNFG